VRLDPDAEWHRSRAADVRVAVRIAIEEVGYARSPRCGLAPCTSLVLLDKRVDRLAKAKRADRFVYASQDFDDSPDYFTSGPALGNATQITPTNPFMSEYAWGARADRYKNKQGRAAAGTLLYPPATRPGRKYPMVVYMYEKLSDGVHQFSAPSERDYYNAAAFTRTRLLLLCSPTSCSARAIPASRSSMPSARACSA
jgi:hypothetical protein